MLKKQIEKKKQHKGRKFNKVCKNFSFLEAVKNENSICTVISSTHSRLQQKHIFLLERRIKKKFKKSGKGFIQTTANISVTKKPSEIRMGKGKGAINHYITRVSPGKRIAETYGVNNTNVNFWLKKMNKKLPTYINVFELTLDKRKKIETLDYYDFINGYSFKNKL